MSDAIPAHRQPADTAIAGTRAPLVALYVPGDRPDRYAKAYAAGADVVIVDLEDAVAPAHKAAARADAVAWLAEVTASPGAASLGAASSDASSGHAASGPALQVRMNAGDGDDLCAIARLPREVSVRVPDVRTAADLDAIADALPGRALTALIESAQGLESIAPIAAHPAVTAIGLGESDLASDLGSRDDALLEYARIRAVVAARAAGRPAPMMSVFPAIQNLEGLAADCRRGRALGMWGRAAVHPNQITVIRRSFAPDHAELEWAAAVIAAVGDGGVAQLDSGEMVDPAMLGRARALLDAARGAV